MLLHDGSPDADESCPDWQMWLAARGVKGVDGTRGPRFNQSSLVIEAAMGGRGVALAKRTLAQDDLDAGRLIAPMAITTAVDFAYYVVHPKAKARLPQVKAFVDLDPGRGRGPRGGAGDHGQRRGDLATADSP